MSNRVVEIKQFPGKETTLESLIEDLDHRGILVLMVLLGQQSMKLLTKKTIEDKTSKILDINNNNTKILKNTTA